MTTVQKQNVGTAIASLVLGISGMVLLGPLGSVPAVICGHIARSRIKKDPESLSGDGMAIAGLILGYLQLVLMMLLIFVVAIPAFVRARETSRRYACICNMRQIEGAIEQAQLSGVKDPGLQDLYGVDRYIKAPLHCPLDESKDYIIIDNHPVCPNNGKGHLVHQPLP